MKPLSVYIGFDERETVAFHVLSHSILSRASKPVAIIPLVKSHLQKAGIYTRPRAANESTDFSLTRFLVPYLSGYEGLSIFMDCDMLCLDDISGIVASTCCEDVVAHQQDDAHYHGGWSAHKMALWCVKHDYTPKGATKFLGHQQATYRCKNWSSLMVFDNAQCRALTPEYVNNKSGLELHQFFWLGKDGEDRIEGLPLAWNHLVGEANQETPPKLIHWTNGGPWLEPYRDVQYADLWRAEFGQLRAPAA